MNSKKRLLWPDVLRAIALYCVILSHLGSFSMQISQFCFGFVMQLFFFISGLFASHYSGMSFGNLLKRLAVRLLIPHIIISAVNICCAAYKNLPGWQESIMQCVLAIRNHILYSTLWFLPCLFVMTVAYWWLSRLIRPVWLRLLLCMAISLAFRIFKEPSQWIWSADTAMMYLFYYALGDTMMPFLSDVSSSGHYWKKVLFGSVAVLCLIPTVLSYSIYNSPEPSLMGHPMNTLALMIFIFFCSVATTMSLTGLSMLLQRSELLQSIGQSTLYLFGTQGIAADIFSWALWQMGITWIPRYGWQTLFLGAGRLLFSYLIIAAQINGLKKLYRKD